MPEDPEYWLAQLELQFTVHNIRRQLTKFSYLAANLPRSLAPDVRDLILHPPEEDPYDALKKAILKRTTMSEERRIQHLLEGVQLGDRKPSQLLRQMQQLAGPSSTDELILRQLWMHRLPESVQSVICLMVGKMPLEEVAEAADRVMDHCIPVVSKVTQSNLGSSSRTAENDTLEQICKRLDQLAMEVNHIRTRSRSRPRYRQLGNKSREGSPTLCWYHKKFQERAHRCIPPCTYKSQAGN